jgi:ABC-type glycerol-3-phosphate transport system permease component
MAGSVLSVTPMLIAFLLLRRRIIIREPWVKS